MRGEHRADQAHVQAAFAFFQRLAGEPVSVAVRFFEGLEWREPMIVERLEPVGVHHRVRLAGGRSGRDLTIDLAHFDFITASMSANAVELIRFVKDDLTIQVTVTENPPDT